MVLKSNSVILAYWLKIFTKVGFKMDLSKAIRLAVDTGKVDLGAQMTKRHALSSSSKLIILAKNCPAEVRNDITHYAQLSRSQVN